MIGELSYENKVTSLWQYGIGKKSMVIHVSVAETGSGTEEISHVMTPAGADGNPDGSRAKTRTAVIRDGEAEIPFPEDFNGTILITCADAAGNAADSVTVSATGKFVDGEG